jgi:hypothetical protein
MVGEDPDREREEDSCERRNCCNKADDQVTGTQGLREQGKDRVLRERGGKDRKKTDQGEDIHRPAVWYNGTGPVHGFSLPVLSDKYVYELFKGDYSSRTKAGQEG